MSLAGKIHFSNGIYVCFQHFSKGIIFHTIAHDGDNTLVYYYYLRWIPFPHCKGRESLGDREIFSVKEC